VPVTTEFRVEGAQETIDTIRQIWQAYKDGQVTAAQMTETLKQQAQAIYAQRRAYTLMRTTLRMQNLTLRETARFLNRVGYIGRQVMSMWTAYTVAQIRVERLSRDVADAQKEVAKWQDLVNQYLRDFGEDSAYYLDAVEQLKTAQDELKESQQDLAEAQQDNIAGYASMLMGAVGLVGQIMYLKEQTDILAGAFGAEGLAGAAGSLSGSLGSLLGVIALVSYFVGGAYVHWDEIKNLWEERIPPAIDELNRALASMSDELGINIDNWQDLIGLLTEPAKYFFYGLIGIVDFLIKSLTGWAYLIRDAHNAFMDFGYWLHDVLDPILARIAGFLKAIWDFLEKIGGATQGFVSGIAQAFGAETTGGIGVQGWKQIGGIIPYTGLYVLHAGEQVIPTVKARGTAGIREVTINQYIGSISSELDLTRAGDIMYKQLMKRLEAKW